MLGLIETMCAVIEKNNDVSNKSFYFLFLKLFLDFSSSLLAVVIPELKANACQMPGVLSVQLG